MQYSNSTMSEALHLYRYNMQRSQKQIGSPTAHMHAWGVHEKEQHLLCDRLVSFHTLSKRNCAVLQSAHMHRFHALIVGTCLTVT